jgi:hypothetical protein
MMAYNIENVICITITAQKREESFIAAKVSWMIEIKLVAQPVSKLE